MSVGGDVDGDGQYEYVVKWDPSNSKDVSQVGYTGNVYVDAYEQDGTQLWRIDLGVNIRAGAHYTQFPVYDFDGDGKAELMMKTAPGSKITTYKADGSVKSEKYVTIPKDDRKAGGVTDTVDYRLSKTGYYEHLVTMFKAGRRTPPRSSPGTGRPRWSRRSASRRSTPTRSATRTPGRSSTTSWTSTRPPAPRATCCATSRASSSTAPST